MLFERTVGAVYTGRPLAVFGKSRIAFCYVDFFFLRTFNRRRRRDRSRRISVSLMRPRENVSNGRRHRQQNTDVELSTGFGRARTRCFLFSFRPPVPRFQSRTGARTKKHLTPLESVEYAAVSLEPSNYIATASVCGTRNPAESRRRNNSETGKFVYIR